MKLRLNQVTLPCVNIEKTIDFYSGKLGLQLIVKTEHYLRFYDGISTSFSFEMGEKKDNPTMIYFESEEVDKVVQELKAKGVQFETDAVDQSWLWREALATDPNGNKVIFYHAGKNRLDPPWKFKGE